MNNVFTLIKVAENWYHFLRTAFSGRSQKSSPAPLAEYVTGFNDNKASVKWAADIQLIVWPNEPDARAASVNSSIDTIDTFEALACTHEQSMLLDYFCRT